jgi:hypothetical protein
MREINFTRTNSMWTVAAAAVALVLAPTMAVSPAAAETYHGGRAHHVRHVRVHVRDSYARAPVIVNDWSDSYHCGLGLYNTPLACEPNN